MSLTSINMETRVVAAAREVVLAQVEITTLVAQRVARWRDVSAQVALPCVRLAYVAPAEAGLHTGWYRGSFQMWAVTHRDDDKDKAVLDSLFGYLLALAQSSPTTFTALLNATAAAQATATLLDVRSAELDGPAIEEDDGKHQLKGVVLALVARPSRAATT